MHNSEIQRRKQYARHAKKTGLSVDAYIERRKTEKWCPRCREWHAQIFFRQQRSSYDGRANYCCACINQKQGEK